MEGWDARARPDEGRSRSRVNQPAPASRSCRSGQPSVSPARLAAEAMASLSRQLRNVPPVAFTTAAMIFCDTASIS